MPSAHLLTASVSLPSSRLASSSHSASAETSALASAALANIAIGEDSGSRSNLVEVHHSVIKAWAQDEEMSRI